LAASAAGRFDITSGKFVFSAVEAYLIEDGNDATSGPLPWATLRSCWRGARSINCRSDRIE